MILLFGRLRSQGRLWLCYATITRGPATISLFPRFGKDGGFSWVVFCSGEVERAEGDEEEEIL